MGESETSEEQESRQNNSDKSKVDTLPTENVVKDIMFSRDTESTERELVMATPETVGINLDQDYIVDARNFWSRDRYVRYLQERDGELSIDTQTIINSDLSQQILTERKKIELYKQEKLENYLASFQGKIKHIRIHPEGEKSPVTPSQAIEANEDGTYQLQLSPNFIAQMRTILKQINDLTIVVQFYDHRRGAANASDVPETSLQLEQYTAICEGILENLGDSIQLEIGNETNISKNTDPIFADKLQHASHVNSSEYAHFYFEVAQRLKEKYPQIKLSLAGIACYDPTYLTEVLTQIESIKKERQVDIRLVDTISFHPYREVPDVGAVEVRNGVFVPTELSYDAQLSQMQEIANNFGINLTVGEINYPNSDPELQKSNDITSKRNIISFIYPGHHVE